jgi:DNA-binding response OmpR family regulator
VPRVCSARRQKARPELQPVAIGPLRLDATGASIGDRVLRLTDYELNLLRVLAEHPGEALTRAQLAEMVRRRLDDALDRSIDVHFSHLRQKLGEDPRHPRLLRTVRGVGYMLVGPD